MAIRTFIGYSQNFSTLHPKLDQIDKALNRTRLNLQANKERIEDLNLDLSPIQDLEQKMRTHYEIIQDLALKRNLEANAQSNEKNHPN